MKAFLRVLFIVIILIVLALFIIPMFFEDEIAERVKQEANKQVDAQIEFTGVNLSLIRAFPDFSLAVNDFSIVGANEFEGDTLVNMQSLFVTVDLFSVFGGDQYVLKRLELSKPEIMLRVLKSGKANWNIVAAPEEEAPPEAKTDTTGGVSIKLNNISVTGGEFAYRAEDINTIVAMRDLDLSVSGDFTAGVTTLKTKAIIGRFLLGYQGVNYVDGAKVALDTDFEADLNKYKFGFEKGALSINDLGLLIDGYFMLMDQGYDMDIAFEAEESDFRSFLSLVPPIYAKNFESIKTSGKLAFDGFVRGLYTGERIPGFELNIGVKDGFFRYPEMNAEVSEIFINTHIRNNGYDVDNTVVDVKQFRMKMADNPFKAGVYVKTPISDPYIDADMKGTINLETVKSIYPLPEDMKISGEVNVDLALQGNMSSIEKKQYDQFKALGYFHAKDFSYQSLDFPQGLSIPAAQINVSPQYLDLVNLDFKYGRSSLKARGKVNNYLAYAMQDGTLDGNLELRSEYFNMDEFIPESEESEDPGEQDAPSTGETVSDTIGAREGVFRVPERINFLMNAEFDKLVYDNITMKNAVGTLRIANQKVIIEGIESQIAGGKVMMEGEYNTYRVEQPEVRMDLDINTIDFRQAYNTFMVVEKFAPIAEKIQGTFSTGFQFTTKLGNDMMPVYETLNGGGRLQTSPVKVNNVNTLQKIAGSLKMDQLESLDLNRVNLSFTFENGKLHVDPFDIQVGNIKSEVQGWTSFDQSINYTLDFTLPKGSFGKKATGVLNDLAQKSLGQGIKIGDASSVNVKVDVTGTTSDPKISTSLKGTGKRVKEQVKEKIEEKIEEKKEQVKKEAKEKAGELIKKANERAEQILNQARNQAENIKKEARRQAQKIRNEADRQAQKVINEAEGKGMLQEMAAKKAAEKIRNEADKKANKVVKEADQRADNIVKKAEKQAEKIREEAREKAGGG
ncbi:MAG: hypothetical protein K9I94_05885 [Bacteroidales bacterium]|nr:hypothetical protein [Bacteroidales bacterium]